MREKNSEQISVRLPYTTMEKLTGLSGRAGRAAFIRDLIEKAHRRTVRRGRGIDRECDR
jgi:predicted DNA-binding protein